MPQSEKYVRHHVFVDVLESWLWVAEDSDGDLYFPVNASCDALEMEARAAHDMIRRDNRIKPGVRSIRLPTAGGEQVQQCLRSPEYAWWLALIDPPRSATSEKRAILIERQRVLMGLAREIMVRGRELDVLPSMSQRQATRSQASEAPREVSAEASGAMEGHFRCLRCGAPHAFVIDGAGWHLHLGIEVE
jgi:hypothetical protein